MRKTALRKIVVNASVQNAFGLEKTQCSNSGLYKEEPLASMVSDTARCKLLENASVQDWPGKKGRIRHGANFWRMLLCKIMVG